jgi:hypothetical protein
MVLAVLFPAAVIPGCLCAEESPVPGLLISGGGSDGAALSSVSASGITIVRATAAEVRVQPVLDGEPADEEAEVSAQTDNRAVTKVYRTQDPLSFVITGVSEGNATLILTWKDQIEKRIPVAVLPQ